MEIGNEYRSGFIALAGRPNVGKSTLVNRIIGRELSIVSPKAQTTRNRITAIFTSDAAQIVMHDLPGILDPKGALNRALVATAVKALQEDDLILLVVTPNKGIHKVDQHIIDLIKASERPAVLAINKIDTVAPPALLPVIDQYARAFHFREIVPVSALTGDGVEQLMKLLIDLLPRGALLFPEDDISDLPTRFFVAEIVREQVTKMTGQEIPYKTAVIVESFEERNTIILIHADIHVERESQKKILVGKGGKMIKEIGIAARQKIEEFLEARVRLELFVKVTPNWTRNEYQLKEFGYDR